MHRIEKHSYGYKLTFEGFIKKDGMKQWIEESKKALAAASAGFGIVVDMRDLKPLPADSQLAMEEGQKLYKAKGMKRSAVIVNSGIMKMQFQRLAKQSGIYEWERYIDASNQQNWKDLAEKWITKAMDPDVG